MANMVWILDFFFTKENCLWKQVSAMANDILQFTMN